MKGCSGCWTSRVATLMKATVLSTLVLTLGVIKNVKSSELHEVVSLPDPPGGPSNSHSFRTHHFSDLSAEQSISRPNHHNQFNTGHHDMSHYPPTYNSPPGPPPGPPREHQEEGRNPDSGRFQFQESYEISEGGGSSHFERDHAMMDRAREQMPYNGQAHKEIISHNLRYLNGNVFGLPNRALGNRKQPHHVVNHFQTEDSQEFIQAPESQQEFHMAQDYSGETVEVQPSEHEQIGLHLHQAEERVPFNHDHDQNQQPHEVIEVIVEEKRNHGHGHPEERQPGHQVQYQQGPPSGQQEGQQQQQVIHYQQIQPAHQAEHRPQEQQVQYQEVSVGHQHQERPQEHVIQLQEIPSGDQHQERPREHIIQVQEVPPGHQTQNIQSQGQVIQYQQVLPGHQPEARPQEHQAQYQQVLPDHQPEARPQEHQAQYQQVLPDHQPEARPQEHQVQYQQVQPGVQYVERLPEQEIQYHHAQGESNQGNQFHHNNHQSSQHGAQENHQADERPVHHPKLIYVTSEGANHDNLKYTTSDANANRQVTNGNQGQVYQVHQQPKQGPNHHEVFHPISAPQSNQHESQSRPKHRPASSVVYQRNYSNRDPSQPKYVVADPSNRDPSQPKYVVADKQEQLPLHNNQQSGLKELQSPQSSQLQYAVTQEQDIHAKEHDRAPINTGVDHQYRTHQEHNKQYSTHSISPPAQSAEEESPEIPDVPTNPPAYFSSYNSQNSNQAQVHQYSSQTVKDEAPPLETQYLPKPKPTPKRPKYKPRPGDYQKNRKSKDKNTTPEIFAMTSGSGAIPGEPGKDYPTYASLPKDPKFSCRGKSAGFYSDTQHKCQVYYQCSLAGDQQGFLCPNGTLFNQVSLVCEWWYNVDCKSSEKHFDKNRELYQQSEPTADQITDESENVQETVEQGSDSSNEKLRVTSRSVDMRPNRRNYVRSQRQGTANNNRQARTNIYVPITAFRNAVKDRKHRRMV